MKCVSHRGTGYGLVRMWGSIGFIVLTVLVGKLLDVFSSETPVVVSTLVLFLLWASTLVLSQPRVESQNASTSGNIWQYALTLPFIVFILSAALLQFSFGSYYGFFSLYMRDLGYSGAHTGLLIATGVVAEVGIFIGARKLIEKFGVWFLLFGCMVFTSLRWLMLATMAHTLLWVMLSQTLHALSFGLSHAASVHFIHYYFDKSFHSRAQAIYISIAFGIGGAAGNYLAGQTWNQGEGAMLSFMISAGVALLGTVILLMVTPSKFNKKCR